MYLPVFAFCLVGHLINAGYTMDNRVTHSQAKIPLIDTAASPIFAILATNDNACHLNVIYRKASVEALVTSGKGVFTNRI